VQPVARDLLRAVRDLLRVARVARDLPRAVRGLLRVPQLLQQQAHRFPSPVQSFTARVRTERTSSSNVVHTPQPHRS
jgi:hypothetical protein